MKILDNELFLDKNLILKYRWTNELGNNEINLIETDSIMADPTININGILGINNSLTAPGYGIFQISDFLLKANDKIDLYHNICAGHLTTNGKAIEFFIPISKQSSFHLIPLLSGIVTIRHADGGYITKENDINSLGLLELEMVKNGVRGVIRLNDKSTFTNNAPITISFGKDSALIFH